jgi:hypothetical protein
MTEPTRPAVEQSDSEKKELRLIEIQSRLNERLETIKGLYESGKTFDQSMMALLAASIGFVFSKEVTPSSNTCNIWLILTVIFLVFAIASILVSFLVSLHAFQQTLKTINASIENDFSQDVKSILSVDVMNIVTVVLYLCSLIFYCIYRLR